MGNLAPVCTFREMKTKMLVLILVPVYDTFSMLGMLYISFQNNNET